MSQCNPTQEAANRRMVFLACFVAIAATASVFVIRGQVINDWATEFSLTETQKGELLGVGLWPFAVTIVLFSLIIDRIGYGKAMLFAFLCHLLSTILLLTAQGYWSLYIGTLVVSLGNGAAQAVADPVIASMFKRDKTKWLNVLHASWPAGMVVGGVLGITISDMDWRWRIAMLVVPFVAYGLMIIGRRFPVHERVTAGVSFKEMLRETGALGMLLVLLLMFGEIGRVFGWHWSMGISLSFALSIGYGFYTRSLGNPLFLFLLILMVPLATTELGTDSWITSLMIEPMTQLKLNAGWILVYTSLIMMILRFCAGPVVRVLSPLGLLTASCILAVMGLLALSKSTGLTILFAATLYGIGKSYLWPTMLGVVAERFPRGGALSLNVTSAVGMMSVGVIGTVFLGYVQDYAVQDQLETQSPALHQEVISEKESVFGTYHAVDPSLVALQTPEQQAVIQRLSGVANKNALASVAVLPALMLLGYLGLYAYFKIRGGYEVVHLDENVADAIHKEHA